MNAPAAQPFVGADGLHRCHWCATSPAYIAYHDLDWGRPRTDDRELFELLSLETFQAGLSWLTILNKRESFRCAFRNFEPAKVSRFGRRDVERLLLDAGIVRHRGKIESTINNAARLIELRAEAGSFASFVGRYRPALPSPGARSVCAESKQLSKDLKARGWRFVGPTTVYSFMQAAGLVNDHAPGCHLHRRAHALSAPAQRSEFL